MKRSVRILWRTFAFGVLAIVLFLLLTSWGVFGKMPSIKELENPTILQASEVFAEEGSLMGKFYLERGNRSNVTYSQISKNITDALVATEDERFYEHSGIDYVRTLGAIARMGSSGGGSTITQQLALNLFDERAANKFQRIMQKVKEWIIAVKLERNFTKEEIITLYLNAVPFGDNIYGIRNASKTFFQKEPSELKPEEAAVLVGMLKANNTYNPVKYPERAKERRNTVIGQMVRNKVFDEAKGEQLKKLPLKTNYKKMDENNGYAPYFREVLREDIKQIVKDLKKPNGESYNIYNDALKIYTTINPTMQRYAEEAVASYMPTMQGYLNSTAKIKNGSVWKGFDNVLEAAMKQSDRWHRMKEDGVSEKDIKASFNVKTKMKVFAWNKNREKDTTMTPMDSIKYHKQMMQASFMAMDPITGEVKAWVGGIDFKTYKFDHAHIGIERQVGSTIKPLLYTQAMEERGFDADTPVEDVAQFFPGSGWVPDSKKGCTGRTVPMANALAFSRNCASAYIMKQVTPAQFSDFVARLNIPTKLKPYASNALGACDLSLFEMMWSYTIFAGSGFSTKPYFISRIEDRNGNIIKRFDYMVNRKEAVSAVTAYKMTRMMQGTVDIGTAKGLRDRLGAAELCGKTGTTNDNTDAWFMGYSPQLLAGTWVGCDDRFIRLNKNDGRGYGNTAARPIWEAFFKKVYANKKLGIDKDAKFEKPRDLENVASSADILNLINTDVDPGGEGEDVGVGDASGYEEIDNSENIGAESKDPYDNYEPEKQPVVVDTNKKKEEPKTTDPKIGAEAKKPEEEKKKKGLINKLFGKKKDN